MMGLNAVKGVEIGAGFKAVEQKGSEHGDAIYPEGFETNHAGGVLGGISSGQDIQVSVAIKPTSSICFPSPCIYKQGNAVEVQIFDRHDLIVLIRAITFSEPMLAIVLLDTDYPSQ